MSEGDEHDVDVSASTARYLRAVHLASAEADGPASTGAVAERAGVTPASVTERVAALADRGLVSHERYVGTELTDAGERVVREHMWRHCLAVHLLGDDADAASFGRALSEEAALALKSHVDHPCTGTCEAPEAEHAACRAAVRQSEQTSR